MIAYVKGAITYKSPTLLHIDVGGLGYEVAISLHTYAQIEKLETVKLLTHFHVKEDAQTLYGFAEPSEKKLFGHLISVSGIGPTTAQVMLSGLSPDDIRAAIVGENVAAFKQVKGIGPKTAKRLILDLKDKLLKDGVDAKLSLPNAVDNTVREEALNALLKLGFNKIKVQKTLNRLLREQPSLDTVEALIRTALQEMG